MNNFRHNDYAFNAPDGWEDGSLVTLIGPAADNLPPPNLTVVREPITDGKSLEVYAEEQLDALEKSFASQHFQLVKQWRDSCISGPAFCRTYNMLLDDRSRHIIQHQAYIIDSMDAFTLTLTCSAEQLQQSEQVFRDVLNSFRCAASGDADTINPNA